MSDTTLVLGGGGIWGVAWMTGLLHGLAESGVDLSAADVFIGTSAGSVVSAQVASALPLAALFARQTGQTQQPREAAPSLENLDALRALLAPPSGDPAARVREIGAIALTAKTIPYAQRRADIAERLGLPADVWPSKRLRITAVDCESGELRAFDAASGASLIDAVAASCTLPGIWPATPIGGRYYMDGGTWRTADNAQLAEGAARVVIVSPVGAHSPAVSVLQNDIALLERAGAQVALIAPNDASRETQALGMLSPACRKPAAEAGRAQGSDAAADVRGALA